MLLVRHVDLLYIGVNLIILYMLRSYGINNVTVLNARVPSYLCGIIYVTVDSDFV